jgi:folylpolyglutamate synthase
VDRWDCITLNDIAVDRQLFLETEAIVRGKNTREGIEATEFELLTAIAFEIFSRERVDVAVVEVGLGGRLDATNILESPLATIITKIGIDHQAFLGSTLEAIAKEKGGIIKKGSRCIVDGTNTDSVLSMLEQLAREAGAESFRPARAKITSGGNCEVTTQAFGTLRFESFLTGNYQPSNLACAVNALSYLSTKYPSITGTTVQNGIKAARWPGRMEKIDISPIIPGGQKKRVLVDGAHNAQAAHALAQYVDKNLRQSEVGRISWVIALSKGKDMAEMFRILLRPGDSVVGVEFGQVDGMPWVSPTSTWTIIESIRDIYGNEVNVENCGKGVLEAVNRACEIAGEGNIVVAGSL